MPSEKRSRKREARMARMEAERSAARRAATRRRAVRAVVAVAALVGLVAAITWFQGRSDDDTVAAGATSTTEAGATTTTAPEVGSAPCPEADGSSEQRRTFDGPPRMCIDTAKTYTAVVTTDVGEFEITLDDEKAPQTVNNFVFLARYHYYDGVTFHRVIPGFVVQGGDPEGTGSGGPGYTFADELPEAGEYEIGSVAMANSGEDTNGSQFFVVTGDRGAELPPSYSLFGTVTKGMDVVSRIEADGTEAGTPKVTHTMKSVTIKES